MAFTLALFAYLFLDDSICSRHQMTNLDHLIIGPMGRLKQKVKSYVFKQSNLQTRPRSRLFLQEFLLTFKDQSPVIGIGILVVGYSQGCAMTDYHFAILSELALFSFIAHLATIMVLHEHFIENSVMRWCRFGLMTVQYGLLCVAMVLVYHHTFLAAFGMPTLCTWSNIKEGYQATSFVKLIPNLLYLSYIFFLAMWLLFPKQLIRVAFLYRLLRRLQMSLSRSHRRVREREEEQKVSYKVLQLVWIGFSAITYIIVFTFIEVFYSASFALCIVFWLLFSSTSNVSRLKAAAVSSGMNGSESAWSAGQFLAIFFFLPLILITALELGYSKAYILS